METNEFVPIPFLYHSLMQTFLGTAITFNGRLDATTEYVDLGDNDSLAIEVATPKQWLPHHPTVVLLHGLCGSHNSPYLVRISKKLVKMGVRSVRVNMRNCGTGRGKSKKIYHCGCSDDIFKAVEHIKSATPDTHMILAGFSLGGNIVLKLAGDLGTRAKDFIDEVYAICPPINLASSMRLLTHPKNKFFERYFLKLLTTDVYFLQEKYPELPQVRFPENLSIFDFDELYVAPSIGFSSAFEYYNHSSAINVLPKISIPARILFAKDDPIIDPTDINNVPLKDNVRIYKTERGGHLGFLGMPNQRYGFRWMDGLVLDWIDEWLQKVSLKGKEDASA